MSEREMRYIYNSFALQPPMPKTKIATLNLRISPAIKEAVRNAAEREHRSVANMIEMLIRRHCDQQGINVPDASEMIPGKING